jgi:hypothetical protein
MAAPRFDTADAHTSMDASSYRRCRNAAVPRLARVQVCAHLQHRQVVVTVTTLASVSITLPWHDGQESGRATVSGDSLRAAEVVVRSVSECGSQLIEAVSRSPGRDVLGARAFRPLAYREAHGLAFP